MSVKRHPVTVRQLLSTISTTIDTKVEKLFKLTLVQKRPRLNAVSKVIKLTCYDFHEAFNPQNEYNRILNCLELPYQSIQNITSKAKGNLAPHTLHLLIPLDDLEGVTDYTKLLASIGYSSVINTDKVHLFINKRKPASQKVTAANVNIIDVTTEEEAHEKMLLRSLERRHPGIKSTFQDPPPLRLTQESKYYLN